MRDSGALESVVGCAPGTDVTVEPAASQTEPATFSPVVLPTVDEPTR